VHEDHPDFLEISRHDFIYIKTRGIRATSYSTEALREDAKFIKSHSKKKKEVFIYFNNDAFGYAPKNAMELISLIDKKKP
jgi:uncharacterized protein YecE (DUF72 family)